MSTRRLLVGATCAWLALALAGCNSSPSEASGHTRPDFQAAKAQWEGEDIVISGALQNAPLLIAVMDLEQGLATRHGTTSGYRAVIAAIKNFESIPLTSVTPEEGRQAMRDLSSINSFFGIDQHEQALLDRVPSGHHYIVAARAWAKEPAGTTSGVSVELLKTAHAALEANSSEDPSLAPLYAAATSDLQNLESASKAAIAATQRNPDDLLGAEIVYLNAFFGFASDSQAPVLEGGM